MSVFNPVQPVQARPAGESDESGSSDDDGFGFDVAGFSRRRKRITPIPQPNQVNGVSSNSQLDDDDWGNPQEGYSTPPPRGSLRKDNWGRTPAEKIRLSCVHGDLERLKSALAEGVVGVDDFFSDDYTPLMTAAANAHPQLVEFLISEKANVNTYHHNIKTTALMAAVSVSFSLRRGDEDILKCVKMIVDGGAKVNFQDKHGLSALMIAVERKRTGVIRYLLIECNANPDLVDSTGRTGLCHAAEMGLGNICRILVENGADVNLVDDSGWSAAELANDKGYYRLAELLHYVRDSKWKPGMNPTLMQEIDEEAAQRKLKTPVADGVTVREDSQIEILLGSFNAKKYIDNFRKHRITYLQFLELDEEHLKEIGIDEVGIRKKIVDSIREIHNHEWQESSIKKIAQNKKITAAEAVCMVNNIKIHLQYMTTTLLSMRKRIKDDPQCLQYGKERNKLKDLISLCKEMDKSNEGLEKEVVEFIQYLGTIEGNAELKLGDEVKSKTIEEVKTKWDNRNSTSKYKLVIPIIGFGVGLVVLLLAAGTRIRHQSFNLQR